jgi:cytochrome c biogenesis protein CcmG/thiol:disulfide interchange protein DsbE
VALATVVLTAVVVLVPLTGSDPDEVTIGGHPLLGDPAPEIDLPTIEGDRKVSLTGLRGRPVLINFWATWCIPCREEFPLMVAAYEEHADDGLEILGIVHDDTVDGARAFAADMGATWPMLNDADDVAWEDYTGVGMPTSLFVDPDGIVRAFSIGPFTETGLAAQLARILPPPSVSPLPTTPSRPTAAAPT